MGSVPPEALQLPLDHEGAVDESGLRDDQIPGGDLQHQSAMTQRQVRSEEVDDIATNVDALASEFRVLKIDLAQGAPPQNVMRRKNSSAKRRP